MFLTESQLAQRFDGKRVAVVGSAPSCTENPPGLVDSYDIVVRINNYKNFPNAGIKTDAYYSFFGTSIRKRSKELIADGVILCICKCPNSRPIESEWHIKNDKEFGIDYRWIYKMRQS